MATIETISKEQVLPTDYMPKERIIFCSNKISKYEILIDDKGYYPILIGAGEIPRIWLNFKTPTNETIALVDDSVSTNDQIKVDIFNFKKQIQIRDIQNGIVILNLNYANELTVDALDLRPIGYNIHGDMSKLVLHNMTLSNNTFNNVNTIIALG